MIEPRIVKGFRDALPQEEHLRRQIMEKLADAFALQGYEAIDTPTLEYTETLLGKSGGETEKQIFRFKDAGERDVAMRFDLTVPLARYVTMHRDELALPFKRYHIAKVWRGEKPQRGRFREFYQCDFDIVGSDDAMADLDILMTAQTALVLLGVPAFVIEVNHRGILLGYLEQLGIAQHNTEILRSLDKVDKLGWQVVETELLPLISAEMIAKLKDFITPASDAWATIAKLRNLMGDHASLLVLENLFRQFKALDVAHFFTVNPKITRGLDYYTGMVFETFLLDDRALGSICSGGRYDNLMALYSKNPMSGVGGSIGLDRLLSAENILSQLNISERLRMMIYAPVDLAKVGALMRMLRDLGVVVEIYPGQKKVDQQTKYALRKGARLGIFVEGEGYTLRKFVERESLKDLSLEALIAHLKEHYLA
ncbi:histidine--tRNA ligase [Entomospira culicis]|uniref:Histidine--tRNA ligase n=1 Tax=Entomospira culicis TaxID=2719989 RepID=A0A968KV80_9SPIO|nr:histidine--tRNA ligase [Entomospira culicis]NIZ18613.1 histidine--tRNA ligase [Entomospira culicis]NIZ68828.1 histidine--tRNA ligase [Entomospira culicis]WDI37422.1 histidine--tRNA ligase [Entomospira culicis]WDI39050.1 histidine--tRNA ligase [Entomospira culicis]